MFLEVNNILKSYGERLVLSQISFRLEKHKTLSILGKSGCGKSTLLKIIAGIEREDGGLISLNKIDINKLNPDKRNIVYLFQEPLLFPHLNVFENIAFGLRIRKENNNTVYEKADTMINSLELKDHIYKMPHQLSGGQKQRVAFGRALILNPPLILLDEPFSSLDVEIRSSMQELYKRIAREFQLTALFVTHDIKEALIMGDAMSYMQDGALKLYDTKEEFMRDSRTGVQNEINFWNALHRAD
jgi:ABC-type sugar transport system ATPase subunit